MNLETLAERHCQHKLNYPKLRGTYYAIELDDLRELIKEVCGLPVGIVQSDSLLYGLCVEKVNQHELQKAGAPIYSINLEEL